MVRMHLSENRISGSIEMDKMRGSPCFLMSSKEVDGVDYYGNPTKGTLIFVHNVCPDDISGVTLK